MAKKVNKKDITSVNKAAYQRYLIIDECLSNRTWGGWTKMELLEKLKNPNGSVRRQTEADAYYKCADQKGLRQLEYDLEDMFAVHDLLPEQYLKKERDGRLMRYSYIDPKFSLRKMPISSLEALHLKSVLEMLARLKGLPQDKWIEESIANLKTLYNVEILRTEEVVEFDRSDYSAISNKLEVFYGPLYDAIVAKRVIKVKWHSFKDGDCEAVIHPYKLKQYNHRWYLIGKSEKNTIKTENGFKGILNVPLDRMMPYLENSVIGYETKTQFEEYDMEDFYYDLIGVTFTKEGPQEIKFKVTDQLKPYIESKPLHDTQTPIKEDNTFIINVHNNYELRSLIRSHGIGLEVLEPLSLREQMREEYEELAQKYR